jgi:hypothetical protein
MAGARAGRQHAPVADAVSILGLTWRPVTSVSFHRHVKRSDPSAPPTLRVDYLCGFHAFNDYLSFERQGTARQFAERFWFAFGGDAPAPRTVAEAATRSGELIHPFEITVLPEGQFWRVVKRRLIRIDGSVVEVDRSYNTWKVQTAPPAPPPSISDEVPY